MRKVAAAVGMLMAGGLVAGPAVDKATTVGVNASAEAWNGTVSTDSNRPTGLQLTDIGTSSPVLRPPVPFDPDKMMRVSDLRPGMKGYGLSVFHGLRPERFEAEVVGVRFKSMMAGQDIILCKLTSPHLENIGVVAGMSGSPVFIDGKLIGAVGYGWPTDRIPLAGVTPIEDMLGVMNVTNGIESGPNGPLANDAGNSRRLRRAFEVYRDILFKGDANALARLHDAPATVEVEDVATGKGTVALKPLAAPIYMSSSSPEVEKYARMLFPGRDFIGLAASGSAGGGEIGRTSPAAPGGPIDLETLAREIDGGWGLGVTFVEGDYNMAGVGTVTYRNGDRLVGFGHPMWEQGISAMPMTGARISSIVHSINRPFKLSETLGQIGMIVQDRLPAVGCLIGPRAPFFPVEFTVDDPRYHGQRTMRFNVWQDREGSANYLMLALMEVISAAARGAGDTTALLEYELKFDNGTTFKKQRFISDTYGGMMGAMAVASEVGLIASNPYKPALPVSVNLSMRVETRRAEVTLLSAESDRDIYRPGDAVKLSWKFQPYRKPVERGSLTVNLPAGLADGDYVINVQDARSRMFREMRLDPGALAMRDYDAVVRALSKNYPANRVYVTMEDRDGGINLAGEDLKRLPASVMATMEATADSEDFSTIRGNLIIDADAVTPYQIEGEIPVTIRVSRRGN